MSCGITCTVIPKPTYSWICPICNKSNVAPAVKAEEGIELEQVRAFFRAIGEEDVVEILTMPSTVTCKECGIECATIPEAGKAVI